MFGLIGGAVVYGFAIYGVVRFLTGFKREPFDAD
jgi:hypothetical protein